MQRLWLSALALALALPAACPAVAATHRETDLYERKRVEPGELIVRTLGCKSGDLTGGGYMISGQPEDRILYNVTASFPLADGRWRVDLRNVSGERQPLTLRVYVLCTD
ncbi:MAG: hypothetical protein ACE368_05495 [Paracoccaceae bacterium]